MDNSGLGETRGDLMYSVLLHVLGPLLESSDGILVPPLFSWLPVRPEEKHFFLCCGLEVSWTTISQTENKGGRKTQDPHCPNFHVGIQCALCRQIKTRSSEQWASGWLMNVHQRGMSRPHPGDNLSHAWNRPLQGSWLKSLDWGQWKWRRYEISSGHTSGLFGQWLKSQIS